MDESENMRVYLHEIAKAPLLSADEEQRLATAAHAGDEESKKSLVFSNLRLVVAIANRYSLRDRPLLDLVQEGNLGLLRAVDNYDPEAGQEFTTVATSYIRRAIDDALGNWPQPN